MTLAQIILAHNNKFAYVAGKLSNAARGSVIHEIDAATAEMLAPLFEQQASAEMPLSYALACVAIESAFDPLAVGANYLGSNAARDLEGFDLGLVQLKARYLIGEHGIKTAHDAAVFAFTPSLALGEFFGRMAWHLKDADRVIATFKKTDLIHPLMRSRWLFATGAYNFGDSGVLALIGDNKVPSHCLHVLHLEALFAQQLGQASVIGVKE